MLEGNEKEQRTCRSVVATDIATGIANGVANGAATR